MPCVCQNKKKYQVVVTVTDQKTQQTKEEVVYSTEFEKLARKYVEKFPGSTIRETDPKKK